MDFLEFLYNPCRCLFISHTLHTGMLTSECAENEKQKKGKANSTFSLGIFTRIVQSRERACVCCFFLFCPSTFLSRAGDANNETEQVVFQMQTFLRVNSGKENE